MLGVFECVERCHNLDAYGNNPSNASRNIQHMLGYQLLQFFLDTEFVAFFNNFSFC